MLFSTLLRWLAWLISKAGITLQVQPEHNKFGVENQDWTDIFSLQIGTSVIVIDWYMIDANEGNEYGWLPSFTNISNIQMSVTLFDKGYEN